MGFIKAFTTGLGSSFANQWKEYMTPPANMTEHVAIARAVQYKADRGENNDAESNNFVISDGSRFMVPEGTCLITMENGAITNVIAEPGGYEYKAQNIPEARSLFAGDGFFASTFGQSWEQFKFGGQPGNQQVAFYVNLKAMTGFHYGTQNPARYQDANYNNIMLAVISNGTYSIQVVDPILFIKNLVPADITSGQGAAILDLDKDSGINDMLFSGFVGSLAAALSAYTKGGKSIDSIQGGTVEFAQNINAAVENVYQWGSKYGLAIASVEPMMLDWDQTSIDQINRFNTGTLMQGTVGQAYAQTQVAEGFNAAGQNAGTNGMMGMGFATGMMGMNGFGAAGVNPVNGAQQMQMQQPMQQPVQQPAQPVDPNMAADNGATPVAQ